MLNKILMMCKGVIHTIIYITPNTNHPQGDISFTLFQDKCCQTFRYYMARKWQVHSSKIKSL